MNHHSGNLLAADAGKLSDMVAHLKAETMQFMNAYSQSHNLSAEEGGKAGVVTGCECFE
jgi:hypothetical protein